MLSKSQKLLLAQLVRENRTIVYTPFSLTVTKKAKQKAWQSILSQINGIGASVGDVIWVSIRQSTIKKSVTLRRLVQEEVDNSLS